MGELTLCLSRLTVLASPAVSVVSFSAANGEHRHPGRFGGLVLFLVLEGQVRSKVRGRLWIKETWGLVLVHR